MTYSVSIATRNLLLISIALFFCFFNIHGTNIRRALYVNRQLYCWKEPPAGHYFRASFELWPLIEYKISTEISSKPFSSCGSESQTLPREWEKIYFIYVTPCMQCQIFWIRLYIFIVLKNIVIRQNLGHSNLHWFDRISTWYSYYLSQYEYQIKCFIIVKTRRRIVNKNAS